MLQGTVEYGATHGESCFAAMLDQDVYSDDTLRIAKA